MAFVPYSNFPQALTAWFYPGQPEVERMLVCSTSIAEAAIEEVAGSNGEEAGLAVRTLARALRPRFF